MNQKEYVTNFDQLYDSMTKCKKGVTWKPSTKSFVLNDLENIHRMERQLKDGTWKNGKPRPIKITYPKKRDGLSISFKDRIYQRSINDNALYPQITRHFIYANAACQKGKGTDFTRKLVKKYLWNYFCKYGNEGGIIQIDIHGYYPNMIHKEVSNCFQKGADPEIHKMSMEILNEQYSGEVGYNPGSQMVQIAGISILNDLDHFIKEQLHAKYYVRYMDDIWILWHDFEDLKNWFEIIKNKLEEIGFELNEKKSHITKLNDGFNFLGFRYKMTETGKITMKILQKNVRHEKRKIRKMVLKSKQGIIPKEKVNECYESWRNHVSKGTDKNTVLKSDRYYKSLWRDRNAEFNQKNNAN